MTGSRSKIDDQTLMLMIGNLGIDATARELGMNRRALQLRRRRIEERYDVVISRDEIRGARIEIDMQDMTFIVGSDPHYVPGPASTGHRAFIQFVKHFQPAVVIMNGDVIDAATVSRFPPMGWETAPELGQEIVEAQMRMKEIRLAAPGSRFIWPLGNHDARFETRLATVAQEFKGIPGVHLKDHFPDWEPCWSVDIGGRDGVMIKHRFKGGIHAPWNNVLYAGRSIITSHLHGLRVHPFSDYNGTRYGVDTGCIADPSGPQFTGYTEDNPLNWRQGFVVCRIKDHELLWPEIVHVLRPGVIQFRGETHHV